LTDTDKKTLQEYTQTKHNSKKANVEKKAKHNYLGDPRPS